MAPAPRIATCSSTAARLLAARAAGTRCELICEWHEDYLVVTSSGVEPVSVKHRENHLAAWTIASLSGEDGNSALLARAAFELTDDCFVWWWPRDPTAGEKDPET